MIEQITMWDRAILLFVQDSVQTPILTKAMNFITTFGEAGWFWFLMIFLLLAVKRYRWIGLRGLVSLVIEFVLCNMVLKLLFARVRPYIQFPEIICLSKVPHDFSFPSGHAGASFAVGFVMFLHLPKKYGVPALIFAGLIAASRIYLCVHFPSDVLAGVVVGILTAYAADLIAKRFPGWLSAPAQKTAE